jgi:hypothetical protein
MGQYIRHGIAVLVAAIVGAVLGLFGLTPDLLTPDQADLVSKATAFLETAAWLFFTLVAYPVVEKFLKRFPSIDLRGYIDRVWLKHEAENPSADTRHLL